MSNASDAIAADQPMIRSVGDDPRNALAPTTTIHRAAHQFEARAQIAIASRQNQTRSTHTSHMRRPRGERVARQRPLTIDITDNNISYMRTEAPLLAPIFRSDGQARLLSVILLGADELSLTDLAARAELAYPTAHREVARLLDAGILVERQVGRTRLLSANPGSALVPPLRDVLQIVAGPVILLSRELADIDGVESAFLYGSFAARLRGVDGPAPNDIDVMVIGAPDAERVYEVCDRVEEVVHRPVNATILARAELGVDSGFLDQVRANPTVPIIGDLPW